ncbi:hypothetical protein IFM89_016224 [Coptis chinensis]|uniref:Uncharacterized protein n=1 Tax=Coptis chinensis TaxID=261450 RepID=A0A835I2N5_9MAGN|nr:hypothetical protein IFM89_016224 [Coptis chinensis]
MVKTQKKQSSSCPSSSSCGVGRNFFKVFLPSHSSKTLKIPSTFIKDLNGALPEKIILKDSLRRLSHIEVKKVDNDFFFQNGWQDFAKNNSLVLGEFLVFRYNGNSIFDVKIYDHSGCQKDETLACKAINKSTCFIKEEEDNEEREAIISKPISDSKKKCSKAVKKSGQSGYGCTQRKGMDVVSKAFGYDKAKPKFTSFQDPKRPSEVPYCQGFEDKAFCHNALTEWDKRNMAVWLDSFTRETAEQLVIERVGDVPTSNRNIMVQPKKRSPYKFGKRTSGYFGVTRHKKTGKYEAEVWDNSTACEGSKRKGGKREGKQIYLGTYETEVKAAQIHDLGSLKYGGSSNETRLNFPISNYEKELVDMRSMSLEEYVKSLRRLSDCFTRGRSIYRGVSRRMRGNKIEKKWQARIVRFSGDQGIHLGTFDTEEEAAKAYDVTAIKLRGMNAITNFDICNYFKEARRGGNACAYDSKLRGFKEESNFPNWDHQGRPYIPSPLQRVVGLLATSQVPGSYRGSSGLPPPAAVHTSSHYHPLQVQRGPLGAGGQEVGGATNIWFKPTQSIQAASPPPHTQPPFSVSQLQILISNNINSHGSSQRGSNKDRGALPRTRASSLVILYP